jgi:hypothetical protein
MQVTVTKGISRESVRRHLPKQVRTLLSDVELKQPRYTIVQFPLSRHVVRSPAVAEALTGVGIKEPIIAVARCFTAEALDLLRLRGAHVLATNWFHWTDSSYVDIHTVIGTHRPVLRPLRADDENKAGSVEAVKDSGHDKDEDEDA